MKKSNGTVEYDNGASQETLPSSDVDLFTSLCYHYLDKLEFVGMVILFSELTVNIKLKIGAFEK